MKRRTLDIMFSTGGLLLAGLLLILGLVLTNRASFAEDYVGDELGRQTFSFKAADELSPEEAAFTEARTGCVIEYAGQDVTSGKQAECYANEYLGAHLGQLATRLGMDDVAYVDGMNYVELGGEQARLRSEIEDTEPRNPEGVAALEQELEDVTFVRTKMFEGTMLRNALLTSYGFGEFGETAESASTVAYVVSGLLLLLSIAGFIHALVTPREVAFALPELRDRKPDLREPARV